MIFETFADIVNTTVEWKYDRATTESYICPRICHLNSHVYYQDFIIIERVSNSSYTVSKMSPYISKIGYSASNKLQ